jgi:sugar phosphate permease
VKVRFGWGWLVLGVSTLVVLLGAGTRAAPGALLLGIQADTGWSTAEVTLAGAGGLLLLGLGGPASGILIDRFGVRRVAVAALVLTCAGMVGAAVSRELWQLVLTFGLVSGFGAGLVASSLGPVVANRRLLLAFYVFRGLSLLYLPQVHSSVDIVGFAVLFGLDYIATVPPTVALFADTFGRRNVGIIYGWVYFAHMVGAAIAAEAAGLVRDNVGSYALAFFAAGWIAGAAGVAALVIRRNRPDPAPAAQVPTAA